MSAAVQLSAWCARWICCGSLARAFRLCSILCTLGSSLTAETPSAGAVGCPEALLEMMMQPGLYKDARKWLNPTEIAVTEGKTDYVLKKKKQTTNKKQQINPELYLVLLLLSSHCYFFLPPQTPLAAV